MFSADYDGGLCLVTDEGLIGATSVQGDGFSATINVGDELTEDLITDTGLFLVGLQGGNNRLRQLEDETIGSISPWVRRRIRSTVLPVTLLGMVVVK